MTSSAIFHGIITTKSGDLKASVCRSMSGETPDLHKGLRKSIILETLGSFRWKVGNLAAHELAVMLRCQSLIMGLFKL
jgi:hypothetical protein